MTTPDQPAQGLHALIPNADERTALWGRVWAAYYEQYNAFRAANPGWQAFFTDHHSSSLDAALEVFGEELIARGVAEGRRQAVQQLLDRAARQEAIAAQAGVASAWAAGLRTAVDVLTERTCRHCGHVIVPNALTSTGWTHGDEHGDSTDGRWVGVRCPGKLCGAEPAERAGGDHGDR